MSNVREVKVPDIGDFDTVDVIEVLVSVGDVVDVDDSLVTLESDKASMEIPSPLAGKVMSLGVAVGDQVGEGHVVLTMDAMAREGDADEAEEETPESNAGSAEESSSKETRAKGQEDPEPKGGQDTEPVLSTAPPIAEEQPASAQSESGGLPPHASPGIRRFARELGVDLRSVDGSGPKGRILAEDVQGFVKGALRAISSTGTAASAALSASAEATGASSAGSGAGIPEIPAVDFSKFGPVTEQKLSRIRRASARNLSRAWLNVPHVTQFDEADVTDMEEFRKGLKPEAERRGVKLTPLAFLLKVSVAALKEFPDFNSSLAPSGESLIVKGYYHIGVAVDTPKGLVVPVIRDVDQKSLFELAAELGEVSERARDGKLTPLDIQGACFTISSLGGIGGTNFTPIVNAPEVAILGVARSKWQPVYDGKGFVPRLMLPFSVSYDHRVVDGASGVRFTGFLSRVLSDLRRLAL